MTQTKEVLVTPEIAKEYLSHSHGNRKLIKTKCEAYAREMIAGRWYLSENIKFDVDGNLLDANHRLNAVIIANVPVLFVVTTGYPKESLRGINMATPWRNDQISKAEGDCFSKYHFSLPPILEHGIKGVENSSFGDFYKSYQDKKDMVLKYESALNFAAGLGCGHNRFVTTIILGVVARAYYSQDPDRLKHFIEVLQSGETYSREDSGAIRLRNYMISVRERGNLSRPELYLRAESAVWNFCKRKPVAQLKVSKEERFPLKLNKNGEVVAA
jgi:hypothetical protein